MSAPPSKKVFVLKPDEIGDFVLATGCIRLLADRFGEENLWLAVGAASAPLARSQFPRARIIPLTFRRRRKFLNVTTVNIFKNLPAWLGLLGRRVEVAACLRSMRSYLHTTIFFSVRARRFVACRNLLSLQKRRRRPLVEAATGYFFRPELLEYPAPGGKLPSDLEANRLVAQAILGREVGEEEILPLLTPSARRANAGGEWLLCPFSSTVRKDVPASLWAGALVATEALRGDAPLLLAAAPYQLPALEKFASDLMKAGVRGARIFPPGELPELVDRIADASLILTVDTAAAHFACALRRPAIIVSAGQHFGVYGPYSPDGRQSWIFPEVPFSKERWFDRLPPDAIADAIRRTQSLKPG